MSHRLKALRTLNRKSRHTKKSLPSLEKFVEERDYIGAITFLNYSDKNEVESLLWKGYCAFHNHDYETAQDVYINLLSGNYKDDIPEETILYLACVYTSMQLYSEAYEAAQDGPNCALKSRLVYFLSQKIGKDDTSGDFEMSLRQGANANDDTVQNQLCQAAILYSQCNFQEACEIYKQILAEDRSRLALNYYIAMCYFKMDYYDVSLESLLVYQQSHDDSIAAKNLKACNSFRLYNGIAALDELKEIEELERILNVNDLLRHNMIAFTDGQKALQVLPPIIDLIPEAKLNLALYHLHNDEVALSFEHLQGLDAVTPQENILLAVTLTKYSQSLIKDSEENIEFLKEAKSYFHLVGTSPNDADTIPGRQCMAQYHFLENQFEDVNVYLDSIRNYMAEDDDFNWNYGVSLVATGDFDSAEEILSNVQSASYRKELCYIASAIRAFIMNGKPKKAWDLSHSVKFDNDGVIFLLQMMGNDCFRTQNYLYAAKAFHSLIEIEGNHNNDYIDALVSSCVGAFQRACYETLLRPTHSYEVDSLISDILQILNKHDDNKRIESVKEHINQWKKF